MCLDGLRCIFAKSNAKNIYLTEDQVQSTESHKPLAHDGEVFR